MSNLSKTDLSGKARTIQEIEGKLLTQLIQCDEVRTAILFKQPIEVLKVIDDLVEDLSQIEYHGNNSLEEKVFVLTLMKKVFWALFELKMESSTSRLVVTR